MTTDELAKLAAAGAGAAVYPDPKTGFPLTTPAKAAVGYARCVNHDGSVLLTAFCFDGTRVDVLVPAP